MMLNITFRYLYPGGAGQGQSLPIPNVREVGRPYPQPPDRFSSSLQVHDGNINGID